MATTFVTVTKFQLELLRSSKIDGGPKPAGAASVAPDGQQWVRVEYELSLYRIGEGLTAFKGVSGLTTAGDTIFWTGGSVTMTGSSTMTFTAGDHTLVQEYPGANIWRESVTYKWISIWVLETASVVPAEDEKEITGSE